MSLSCVLGAARRKITLEQSSVWQTMNHGFSKASHAFLCLHSIPGVTVQWPCPYAVCKFTIVLTPRLYIPPASFVLVLAAMWLCCENESFPFLWDKCSATLVSIPHCFGLCWLWNPPLVGRVRKRSVDQYSKPIFTMSSILCSAREKRISQNKSVRKVHELPRLWGRAVGCCFSVSNTFSLHWIASDSCVFF